jgi:hypothetical protein
MKTRALHTLALTAIATVAIGSAALAGSFTIYSTGYTAGSTSNKAAKLSADGNYTVVEAAGTTLITPQSAYVVKNLPWPTNGAIWDSTQAGDGFTDIAPGIYEYQTTFVLPSNYVTAVITGSWAVDNAYDGIYLNGVFVPGTITPSPTGSTLNDSLTSFTINSGFQAGTNTLSFFVDNTGTGVTPTGIETVLSGTDTIGATPEPSTVAVYAFGSLAVLGFIVRKKRIS